ncbi:MAG: hypothetical protein C0605_02115 [Hyphomicrobiales bacterium]|nr:MAG: hypothetical protein C0605_02115 [Hyphomicrobiales bacterium]
MSTNTNGATPQRLRDVIAAYGGDPGRWPDDERDGLLTLLRGNAEAAAARDEARALDQVLDSAAAPPPSAALRAGILSVAAPAAPAGTGTTSSAKVIPFRRPDRAGEGPAPHHAAPRRTMWPTAALLAASLLIGVWIGAAGIGGSLVSETLDFASLNSSADTYDYDIGLSEAEGLL